MMLSIVLEVLKVMNAVSYLLCIDTGLYWKLLNRMNFSSGYHTRSKDHVKEVRKYAIFLNVPAFISILFFVVVGLLQSALEKKLLG